MKNIITEIMTTETISYDNEMIILPNFISLILLIVIPIVITVRSVILYFSAKNG